MQLRVERARELLLYSDRPVIEVAVAAGFSSTSHFADLVQADLRRAALRHARRRGPTAACRRRSAGRNQRVIVSES